ncbi:MAG: type II secretion system F family protein [Gammaproteobacteria bacterium]|nr:type II secretion system F family protein [Gammaproteobacteria bacterium]
MPIFQYRGRNQRGDVVTGQVDAVSPDAVATQLFNSGVVPVDITLSKNATYDLKAVFQGWFSSDKVELVDLILFTRQFFTLIKAGVPIMQALRGLRDSTQNPAFRIVINDVVEVLDSGLELSSALKRHPKVFPTLYVSMVQVGEATGTLQGALLQLAKYLELEKDTRDRIKSALRYPIFVVIAIAIALVVINLLVIPAFAKVFANLKTELPWATRVLIGTSKFTVAYWPLLLGTLITAFISIRIYIRTPEGRYRFDRFKLRVPVIGSIIYRSTVGRFARALAVSLQSGVPLVQGMTVVSRAVDNEFIGERILQMRDGVERGETIARTAAATGLFPPLVLQMISVGEESGSVDELMAEVAEHYEREVDYDLKNLAAAIQPLLIVGIGAIVLVLALGVFLPMWELPRSMLGH